jgi:hypothetical protein
MFHPLERRPPTAVIDVIRTRKNDRLKRHSLAIIASPSTSSFLPNHATKEKP